MSHSPDIIERSDDSMDDVVEVRNARSRLARRPRRHAALTVEEKRSVYNSEGGKAERNYHRMCRNATQGIVRCLIAVQFSSVHSFILIRKSFSTWADLPGNRIQGNDSKRRKEKNDNIYNYNYITSKSVHRVLIEIVLQAQFKDRGIITPSYDCRKRIP